MRHRYLGFVVVLLSSSAALLWYMITPPFEAPDEHAHFGFVRYLAAERRLPDGRPEIRKGWESHEWIQPPTYYVLLASIVAVRGADAKPPVPSNPNNRFNSGSSTRTFTWDGQRTRGSDAVFVARLASLILGVLTVFLIYKAAATVLGSSAQAAVAAAGLALVPQYTFLIAAVSNDTLVTTMSAATVALLVTIWSTPVLSMRTAILIGVCAGLALITKISAVFLFPMIAVAVLSRRHDQRARAVAFLLVSGVTAAAVAAWYFVRNMIVFGDLLATQFKIEIVSDVATPQGRTLTDPYFYTQFPTEFFLTFWGRFGWLTIATPTEALMVYGMVTGLLTGAIAVFLIEIIRGMRSGQAERRLLAAMALCLGIFTAWKAYRISLTFNLPPGLLLSHIHVVIAMATGSFMCLILTASPLPVDRRARQIAFALVVGIATFTIELLYYNLNWGAAQARLMYPALAPVVIVAALAVRNAGDKLRWAPVTQWTIPLGLAALGVAWVVSFAAAYMGWHVVG